MATKDQLFYLDEALADIFADSKRRNFEKYLDLTVGQSQAQNLLTFRHQIEKAKQGSDSLFIPESRTDSQSSERTVAEEEERRKRRRIGNNEMSGSATSSDGTDDLFVGNVEIKTEEQQARLESIACLEPAQQVKIFFGNQAESQVLDKDDINKSGTLKSWITEDEGTFHIMNPKLVLVDPTVFKVVLEFL